MLTPGQRLAVVGFAWVLALCVIGLALQQGRLENRLAVMERCR
jgi:hypothetical protein